MKPEMRWEEYLISVFLMQLLYLVGVLHMTFNLLTCVHSQGTSLTLRTTGCETWGLLCQLEFTSNIFLLTDPLKKLVFNLHNVDCVDDPAKVLVWTTRCVPLLLLKPNLMRFKLDWLRTGMFYKNQSKVLAKWKCFILNCNARIHTVNFT